jgi:hypothetical protein
MLVGFCTESVEGERQDTPPLLSTTSLQEVCLPTIPWGHVDDQLEEEMDPSTIFWRTIIFMDIQEDPSLLSGDLRVDHHRHLNTANQVWQGPYWAVRTQNRIPINQCIV